MAKSVLHTKLCDLLGVEYPIIQTGMGFVTPPRLVAAVCNAGGFGILGAASWDVEETREKIHETKKLTDKPFGVNFLPYHPRIEELLDLLIDEKVKVASYARAPSSKVAERTKPHGILNIASIGAVRHAAKTEAWGIDAVIAQGMEGGGHTGYVASTVLIPEVVDTVKIPVVAAGGFCDGRGLVAALAWGAAGIAMGTRFLLTKESPIPDHIKQVYLNAPSNGTIVSDRIDGLPQRVLKSRVVDILESQGRGFPLVRGIRGFFQMRQLFTEVPWWRLLESAWGRKKAYEVSLSQLALAGTFPRMLTRATVDGNADEGVMPGGQVSGIIKEIPSCQELIEHIVSQAEEILDRFGH